MTQCSFQTPLTDEALSLVIDGYADEGTQDHLAQCPSCSARLEVMKRFDGELQRRLKRFECPSPRRLADYHAGMLDAKENRVINQHIADCPRCQKEIQVLVEFMKLSDDPPTASNIIDLSPPQSKGEADRLRTVGSLALKGIEDENFHDAKVGSANVFLEWTAVPKGFLLTGQILDPEVSWLGAIAEVWQAETLLQVSVLDDQCEFRFEFMQALSFDLRITALNGITIVVEKIKVQT